jgi:hypothetical protein
VRMEVAASLCSPGHQVPHGSRLRADTIIYPKVYTPSHTLTLNTIPPNP